MSLHRHRIGVSTQSIYETRESFNCYIKKIKSSVIRQKSESQNGRFKKCSFFGKFGVLYFLETPVLRFALLPYYPHVDVRGMFFDIQSIRGSMA